MRAHVAALSGVAGRVVVVLGADAARISAVLDAAGVRWVENPAWEAGGMMSSVVAGLDAVGDGPAWVTPVDVPPVAPAVGAALAAAGGTAVPVDPAGRPGHPVLLSAALVARLRASPPPGGLRDALADAVRVPVADALVALDFDDPASFARISRAAR